MNMGSMAGLTDTFANIKDKAGNAGAGNGGFNSINIDNRTQDAGDSQEFKAAFNRHQDALKAADPVDIPGKESLGKIVANKARTLAVNVQEDQKYVSKLLEKASASGDSMQLMHAMMAMNDYQLRVQTISKVVAKASSSVDSLTKLQ